jgi:hypothetical protein
MRFAGSTRLHRKSGIAGAQGWLQVLIGQVWRWLGRPDSQHYTAKLIMGKLFPTGPCGSERIMSNFPWRQSTGGRTSGLPSFESMPKGEAYGYGC